MSVLVYVIDFCARGFAYAPSCACMRVRQILLVLLFNVMKFTVGRPNKKIIVSVCALCVFYVHISYDTFVRVHACELAFDNSLRALFLSFFLMCLISTRCKRVFNRVIREVSSRCSSR